MICLCFVVCVLCYFCGRFFWDVNNLKNFVISKCLIHFVDFLCIVGVYLGVICV
jgi:hypothetical protein